MKTIKREDAIEIIIGYELKRWEEKFYLGDTEYFDDLLRNGGFLVGYEDMNNKDLEDEYYEMFEVEVFII